jgi:hypothetical protein
MLSKVELVQQWDNVPVTKDGFVETMGMPIVLSYINFLPVNAQMGEIMFTFNTAGKSYTVDRIMVLLVAG